MPCALLIALPGQAGPAETALNAIGARIGAVITPDQVDERLGSQCLIDLLAVETAHVAPPVLRRLLPQVASVSANHRTRVVVTLDPDQIDDVAGELMGTPAVLLCDPSLPERVAALAVRPSHSALHEIDRRADAGQIARLSEEVERIARTLARLAGEEGAPVAPAQQGRHSDFTPPSAGASEIDPAAVRSAIRARRLREQFIDRDLLGEPGWDILLDLFAAELEQLRVSVSSLCIAAAVPPTTALRWITGMTEAGMLERSADTRDRRRAFVTLASAASVAMRNYFAALQRQGLSPG